MSGHTKFLTLIQRFYQRLSIRKLRQQLKKLPLGVKDFLVALLIVVSVT
jgi:hypothetical protein